jgi:hypothetical protein
MSDSNPGTFNRRRSLVAVILVLAGVLIFVLLVRPTHTSTDPNSSSTNPSTAQAAFSYTCCRGSVMNAIYHPGGVITVHWIRTVAGTGQHPATPITLSLSLSGPYRTVSALKRDSIGRHPRRGRTNARAKRIIVLDTALDSPISLLKIPKDAGSGYYNLTTTIGTKNLTVGGSGIVRVEPPGP